MKIHVPTYTQHYTVLYCQSLILWSNKLYLNMSYKQKRGKNHNVVQSAKLFDILRKEIKISTKTVITGWLLNRCVAVFIKAVAFRLAH